MKKGRSRERGEERERHRGGIYKWRENMYLYRRQRDSRRESVCVRERGGEILERERKQIPREDVIDPMNE